MLKDCHEKVLAMGKHVAGIEKTDHNEKLSTVTRKMIGEVVREHLTPVQMQISIEIKSIKKLVEEHAYTMEQFEDKMKAFKEQLEDFRLKNIYDL